MRPRLSAFVITYNEEKNIGRCLASLKGVADEIIVLDGGRVAERGTHADLLRQAGLYAEMWARQQAEDDEEGAVAAE